MSRSLLAAPGIRQRLRRSRALAPLILLVFAPPGPPGTPWDPLFHCFFFPLGPPGIPWDPQGIPQEPSKRSQKFDLKNVPGEAPQIFDFVDFGRVGLGESLGAGPSCRQMTGGGSARFCFSFSDVQTFVKSGVDLEAIKHLFWKVYLEPRLEPTSVKNRGNKNSRRESLAVVSF